MNLEAIGRMNKKQVLETMSLLKKIIQEYEVINLYDIDEAYRYYCDKVYAIFDKLAERLSIIRKQKEGRNAASY